jgi:integrase
MATATAFTGSALTKFKADPHNRREIPDGVLSGLYFVIQPTGKKSWAVRYRIDGYDKNGQPAKVTRKFTLGNYLAGDDVKLAGEELKRIRREAADILDRVRRGEDPGAEKQIAKRAPADDVTRDLFRSVVERYLKEYASKRRNFPEKARLLGMRRDGEAWAVIEGRAVSLWGQKRAQDITRRDVREHLEALAESAPIGANRTFSELRKFFNWAAGKDIVTASPLAGLQPPSEENASRNRVLIRRSEIPGSTDDELRWLWQAAANYNRPEEGEGKGGIGRKHRGPFGPMVQMLILTGQRRTEVAAMEWREVDLEARTWTIPASRAKNGQAHLVPLSDAAVAVLESLPRIKGHGYVFTTDGENPVSGFSRMKNRIVALMKESAGKEIPDWTLHDIRRTVAAGMQRLGVRMEVTEKVLNHVSGSFGGIAGVYQVHDFAEEKRTALEAWARFVTDLVEGADKTNVVPLRERA